MTVDQIQADNRRMKRFICERISPDGTRIVIADGEDGPAWADLCPLWEDDGDCDLVIEINDPDGFGLREVYEHFRRKEMTWVEWRAISRPRLAGGAASLKQRRCQEPLEEGRTILLRLVQCVRVSGHSESTLRRAIKDGHLKAHSIGRGRKRPTYGILRSDLEAYIEASRIQLPDSPRIPIIGVRKKSRHFD